MTKPVTQHEKQLLAALDKTAVRARDAERDLASRVAQLRSIGVPWETIGRTLGMTRQGAQQRFGA